MAEEPAIESLSLLERVVLLSITDAVADGDDPVDAVAIRTRCRSLLADVEAVVVSDPAESDIARALGVLGDEPFVEEHKSSTSPTGKGRPTYSLHTDPAAALDVLEADDQLADAVETVREG